VSYFDYEEDAKEEFQAIREGHTRDDKYVQCLGGAEMHWHFIQAEKAAESGLWLPAAITLLAGMENSIRVKLRQRGNGSAEDDATLPPVLGNRLLREARAFGLPVGRLAFPGESEFEANLIRNKPDVEIVRVRNDLCHGNVFEYVDRESGGGMHFFTPECLRSLVHTLIVISRNWVEGLAQFRSMADAT
jgi:hypothetical protein